MPKRKAAATAEAEPQEVDLRDQADSNGGHNGNHDGPETPSKRRALLNTNTPSRSILKPTTAAINGDAGTPRSLRKVLFSTPARAEERTPTQKAESPITAARNADRSARRKSAQRFLLDAGDAEDDDAEDEGALAREILDDSEPELDGEDDRKEDEDGDEDEDEEDGEEDGEGEARDVNGEEDTILDASVPDTPSKTPRLRGRPRGKTRRRARSPTPPQHLPPHELYFFQNRPGAGKTSANLLPSNALLDHDDYFATIDAYKDSHESDKQFLLDMHSASFEQWQLELDEGFNICIYGYGSKRHLLADFCEYLYHTPSSKKAPKVVVVNGYTPAISLKDILTTFAGAVLSPSQISKLPLQPAALLDALLALLNTKPPSVPIYLVINSIDAAPMRRPAIQSTFARLASHPRISLVSSADTPTFPLLWDISLRSQFHFLFHDCTTFEPYTAEIDPVDDVNLLLGRSGRRVGGKDGVTFVLRSLPENARSLFRILVAEQLALMHAEPDATLSVEYDEDDLLGAEDGLQDIDVDPIAPSLPRKRGRPPKNKPVKHTTPRHALLVGVEYRTLYHKAVEEFVCSSEMSFRTLLKEFHDHAMIESRKDAAGTERLSVPFGKEELEDILGDLV